VNGDGYIQQKNVAYFDGSLKFNSPEFGGIKFSDCIRPISRSVFSIDEKIFTKDFKPE